MSTPLLRLALLAVLVAANPLLYAWGRTVGGLFPDSIAYLMLARQLADDGSLVLQGLHHVDAGLILPPVYPLLIALGLPLHGDAIVLSQWISGAALLAATVPLFLWFERSCGPWLAAGAVLLLQWHPAWMRLGTSTLTEGVFVLGIAGTGYAASRIFSRKSPSAAALLALGAGAGLVALTRHLGVFLLPALLAALAAGALLERGPGAATRAARHGTLILAGFALPLLLYAGLLQQQSGQAPWTQSYRLDRYRVEAAAPAPAAVSAGDYGELYAQRRRERQLNAAATEMLGQERIPVAGTPGPLERLASPARIARNFADNLGHAAGLAGLPLLLAALAGTLLSLCRAPGRTARERILLPATVLAYLLMLSALTGLLPRYLEPLWPLLCGLGFAGIGVAAAQFGPPALAQPVSRALLGAVALVLLVLARPAGQEAPATPKFGERDNPFAPCLAWIEPGEPVFALHPMLPYLLGGTSRIIPNDSLDRIAAYGRHTGVRYLAFLPNLAAAGEAGLYDHAPWIGQPGAIAAHPDFTLQCSSSDGRAGLFRIRPEAAAPLGDGGSSRAKMP